jgi:hypothetical protein
MQYVTKKTSELAQGDVVRCHGLRCLIDREILISKSHPVARDGSHCRYTQALVLNRDEVSREVVPFGFTADWDRYPNVDRSSPLPHHGEHRWTIQGNDLATWSVEVEDERVEPDEDVLPSERYELGV